MTSSKFSNFMPHPPSSPLQPSPKTLDPRKVDTNFLETHFENSRLLKLFFSDFVLNKNNCLEIERIVIICMNWEKFHISMQDLFISQNL